jgi:hypothetical protein
MRAIYFCDSPNEDYNARAIQLFVALKDQLEPEFTRT